MEKILVNFGLEITAENKEWLTKEINELISYYEQQADLSLPEALRMGLVGLVARIAYDGLCIKRFL